MVRAYRENRSTFVRVKCPDCEHEQIVFEKASTIVDCQICGRIIAEPRGGKAEIRAEILGVFE